ncbi:hypothetical protein INR49_015635 [Caranx melampygus]|nr:hypothetical protein INR49_015635 [Caranx melampygus]
MKNGDRKHLRNFSNLPFVSYSCASGQDTVSSDSPSALCVPDRLEFDIRAEVEDGAKIAEWLSRPLPPAPQTEALILAEELLSSSESLEPPTLLLLVGLLLVLEVEAVAAVLELGMVRVLWGKVAVPELEPKLPSPEWPSSCGLGGEAVKRQMPGSEGVLREVMLSAGSLVPVVIWSDELSEMKHSVMTFKPLLLAFLADNEEQSNTQSNQDDRRANGEQLFHIIALSTS